MHAPAAERNREPLLAVLREIFPPTGTVLEIASGSGQHVVHYAAALPGLTFLPSDLDPQARASVDAWVEALHLDNVRPATALDTTDEVWPVEHADAIVCCNMIHIAPWEATLGLMRGAGRVLTPDGRLWLYGPFLRDGVGTADGNLNFETKLREMDPRYGIRRLEDVAEVAANEGLGGPEVVDMPANNCLVGFERR